VTLRTEGGGRYPGALPEPGWFADEEESRVPIAEVEKIWMDGELVDWADAKIHVLSHALHYGSGVFEGIRAYETSRGPAVWHLEEHLERLFRSAKLYHMDLPYSRDERAHQLLRAADRVPGVRRDGCEPPQRTDQRVDRRLAVGRVPG
jgi:hypothetical protein